MKKKLISLVLAFTMLLGIATPFSYASNLDLTNSTNGDSLVIDRAESQYSISSSEALKTLRKLGFTDEEIINLYQTESNKLNYHIELPSELHEDYGGVVYPVSLSKSRLPSNPQIGKHYPVKFDINFRDLAAGLGASGLLGDKAVNYILSQPKKEIAKQIVKVGGLGQLFTAMEVAGAILLLGSLISGYEGIRGEQTWYYGEDNHLSIGWTPGYIDHELY